VWVLSLLVWVVLLSESVVLDSNSHGSMLNVKNQKDDMHSTDQER
jgi:hypothetical protein